MLHLENEPFIRLAINVNLIPLLDSGYYYDPMNPQQIYSNEDLKNVIYETPGGIIASDVGSGKTISIIGLINSGIMIN